MLLHHAATTLQALYPHNTESAWQRHKKEKNKRAPPGGGLFQFSPEEEFWKQKYQTAAHICARKRPRKTDSK